MPLNAHRRSLSAVCWTPCARDYYGALPIGATPEPGNFSNRVRRWKEPAIIGETPPPHVRGYTPGAQHSSNERATWFPSWDDSSIGSCRNSWRRARRIASGREPSAAAPATANGAIPRRTCPSEGIRRVALVVVRRVRETAIEWAFPQKRSEGKERAAHRARGFRRS